MHRKKEREHDPFTRLICTVKEKLRVSVILNDSPVTEFAIGPYNRIEPTDPLSAKRILYNM